MATAAPTTDIARRGNQVAPAAQTAAGPVGAVIKEAKVTTQVSDEITRLTRGGKLRLPANYSAENALNSAWLILQDIQGRDSKPIMHNGQLTGLVTQRSVVNSLMDMVVQGLNPAKKQCYFIVYGDKLTLQRSYFGDMAVAQRLKPGLEFYTDTINEGDDFAAEKIRNKRGMFVTSVSRHVQPFPRSEKIVGAYCGAVLNDCDLGCDVFDMDRIKKSWAKSKTAGYDNSTHKQYPGEMAMRTVIRHFCKQFINTSDDELLMAAIQRSDADAAEAEVASDAAMHANQEPIDVTYRDVKQAPQVDVNSASDVQSDETSDAPAPGPNEDF